MPRNYSDRDLAILRNRAGENIPVPPAPKKRSNEESRSQCNVVTWWRSACAGFGVAEMLLFAIKNEGWRSPILGKIYKREGLRAGVSDLFLSVPRGQYSGCYIEMKAANGVVSEAQKRFIIEATKAGYAAYACYSYDDAVRLITNYLTTPEKLF